MNEISFYGDIGSPDGVDIKRVDEKLASLKGKGPILIRLHSGGGDYYTGLGIYDRLKSIPESTVIIDGVSASAASVAMLGAGRVIMPSNAWVMVHPVNAKVEGDAARLRQGADRAEDATEKLRAIYLKETGQPEAVVDQWLAGGETWFDAPAALKAGLVDEIVDPIPLQNFVNLARFVNAPDAAKVQLTAKACDQNQFKMKSLLQALVDNRLLNCGCMTAGADKEPDIVNELKASLAGLTSERDSLKTRLEALEKELAGLNAKSATTLQARATAAVEAAVTDGRLAPALRATLVNAYIGDEPGTLKNLSELPRPTAGGTAPVGRGSGNDNKSLEEKIAAEKDPKERIRLRNQSWSTLCPELR